MMSTFAIIRNTLKILNCIYIYQHEAVSLARNIDSICDKIYFKYSQIQVKVDVEDLRINAKILLMVYVDTSCLDFSKCCLVM